MVNKLRKYYLPWVLAAVSVSELAVNVWRAWMGR